MSELEELNVITCTKGHIEHFGDSSNFPIEIDDWFCEEMIQIPTGVIVCGSRAKAWKSTYGKRVKMRDPRPRKFDALDQKIADSLDSAISEYAAAALEGIENPTTEEAAKALSDAIEKVLAGTITIDVTVDI